jgi:hypothetical protein
LNQPVPPATAFAGGVPANLACGFCHRPVRKQFYRAADRFACEDCAAQVRAVVAQNSVSPAVLGAAAAAGLLTALAGAAVWAITVHVTRWSIGYIALFIGYGVGKACLFASGQRRSISLQYLATALAVIGVAVGKLGVVFWQIASFLQADGEPVTVHNLLAILQENFRSVGDPFDLLWMGLAAYSAWRMCKPRSVSLGGPFSYEPTADSLQFNTVEPLHDIPPAIPPGHL